MHQLYTNLNEDKKIKKYVTTRWSILFAGFLLTLMGGFSYAWGVFVIPMMERFGWAKAEAALPFTVFMIIFAFFTIPGGILQDKMGPRKVSVIGAVLFFLSYSLSAFVDRFPYTWWLVITYGVIGGIACGLTYACAAPPARKWFPDKPALATSFTVTGFGLSALVISPLKSEYLLPVYGIDGTFFIIAIITSAGCIFAACLIKNPPDGLVSLLQKSCKAESKITIIRQESIPKEVLRSSAFWVIWLTFVLAISGGIMIIGLIPSYGKLIIGLTSKEAAIAMSIFAGFNGLGRPLAGFIGDRVGVVWVMIFTYIIQTATFLFFHIFAVTLPKLYIAVAFLGLGFAVTLALFPVVTSICFGIKHMGFNYGLVFTAFGVGAIAAVGSSWIFDATGSYAPALISAGIMSGISLVLCVILKKKYALP